jgi:hypothetical protein
MAIVYLTFQVVLFFFLVFAMGAGAGIHLYKIFYGEFARVSGSWGAIVVLCGFGTYFAYQAAMATLRLAFYLKLSEERKK